MYAFYTVIYYIIYYTAPEKNSANAPDTVYIISE